MTSPIMDGSAALSLLGDLVHLTAPPASLAEICDQGLGILGKALGSTEGILILAREPGEESVIASSLTNGPASDLLAVAVAAMGRRGTIEDRPEESDSPPIRIALPLPGDTGPMGAVALAHPADWGPLSSAFALNAVRALAASITVARTIDQSRVQRDLLARRTVAMETLREMTTLLHEPGREDEMLQSALELVLARLGLEAGWIFWGESNGEKLELAAAQGVSETFVSRARDSGIGSCLCQDVFATGRLMCARNTVECPRMSELLGTNQPVAHACVPLKFERGILGVMNIANRPGQVFTPQELQFLETVGSQICLAVDKARSGQAERRRNAEARALVSLARAIGGSLERERVLSAVGDYACELLAANRCAILLGDGDSPPLFAYITGEPLPGFEPGKPADLEAMGSRALLAALRQPRTVVLRDALNDPQANADLARKLGIGSAILVPLIAHDRVEGLLFATRSAPSNWSAEEVAIADALASQAAVAIENASLYRDAQDALLRLQQAQYGMMRSERLAAVGTLAASLAHEVRNPLNSINLQLVLLSRRIAKLAEGKRGELESLIETTRREITRLDGLVEEFLSLSSIDRLSLSENDLDEVSHEVLELLAPMAKQRGVVIQEKFAGGLPRLRIDREKIKQVLINLIRNGVEAMPEGGSLVVSTQTADDLITIQVADTGSGIEPGLDVFDFFMTTKRGGTGLGLPIARRIVEAHGGNLTYKSEQGRGSVFSVVLKCREASPMQGRGGS
jgi:signal transduction histidine kinase